MNTVRNNTCDRNRHHNILYTRKYKCSGVNHREISSASSSILRDMYSRRYGMTLIELMLVVIIVGILTTVTLLRVGAGGLGRPGVQAVVRRIALDIRHARSLAITEGINHYVGFDPAGYTIYRRESPTDEVVENYRTFPQGITRNISAFEFEFEPIGSALGAYQCDVIGFGVTYRVVVVIATGAVIVTKL